MSVVAVAADILGVKDLAQKTVFVEQWDQDVIVQELSGPELQKVLALPSFGGGDDDVTVEDVAAFCCITIRDEDGGRVFTDDQAGELGAKNMKALMTVFKAAMEVSGLTAEDRDREKNG
jgi:hypothetical protein